MELHDTRILIADENPHQRALLREALNRGGYRYIDEAGGGEQRRRVSRRRAVGAAGAGIEAQNRNINRIQYK